MSVYTNEFVVPWIVPWIVQFVKEKYAEHGDEWLAVNLHCIYQNESRNCSYAAPASVELISFDKHMGIEETRIGFCIFNAEKSRFGSVLIRWIHLINAEKGFVHNDSIKLRIKMEAAHPNDENRGNLKMYVFHHCCKNSNNATYQLNVRNVSALTALKTSTFLLQNLRCQMTVFKNHFGYFGVHLEINDNINRATCTANISIQVISSKKRVDHIHVDITRSISDCDVVSISELVSWEILLNEQYGFVTNNSIKMIVKMKVDKPKGEMVNVRKRQSTSRSNEQSKRLKIECTICNWKQ